MMKNGKVTYMAQLSLLLAILLVMAFTPLGYLHIGPLSVTFLVIPVVIGSLVLGLKAGALLGLAFGITSLAQCFGLDPFGTALFGINPLYTVVFCLIPRVLVGVMAYLVFKMLEGKKLACYAASAAGSLTNSVLVLGSIILLFGETDYIKAFGNNVFEILMTLGMVNAVVEVVVCAVVGGLLGNACLAFFGRKANK